MGTSYSVKINQANIELSRVDIEKQINIILDDINARMSTYQADSELSKLNRAAAGEWITVSSDLFEVLSASQRMTHITDGYFDVTVGPLVNLWGFGPEKDALTLPNENLLNHVLDQTGMNNVQLRETPMSIMKGNATIYIDLSGIAKGHAVDKIASHLKSLNIGNYLVEIGGEIIAEGKNTSGEYWRIGIEQPGRNIRRVQRSIQLKDIAMATSGDYRNFRMIDGKYYSHSIDPKSGWPVEHQLASVTVLHPRAADADALATGMLVMGKAKAQILAREKQLPVLFIERDGEGYIESSTPQMKPYLLR